MQPWLQRGTRRGRTGPRFCSLGSGEVRGGRGRVSGGRRRGPRFWSLGRREVQGRRGSVAEDDKEDPDFGALAAERDKKTLLLDEGLHFRSELCEKRRKSFQHLAKYNNTLPHNKRPIPSIGGPTRSILSNFRGSFRSPRSSPFD